MYRRRLLSVGGGWIGLFGASGLTAVGFVNGRSGRNQTPIHVQTLAAHSARSVGDDIVVIPADDGRVAEVTPIRTVLEQFASGDRRPSVGLTSTDVHEVEQAFAAFSHCTDNPPSSAYMDYEGELVHVFIC